jgi:signal transduction histidine kinase
MSMGLSKDSLRDILHHMPEDTGKVPVIIRLGQQYESNQPDSAIYYYRWAGQLSRQLNYPAGIVRYINNYTAVLNVQGKFDESISLNLQAVDISRTHGLNDLYIKALINTGAAYQYKDDYAAAAGYYLKALPLLEMAGDDQSLSLMYGNLCGLYRNLQQPEKALHYARLALQHAERKKDDYAIAQACNNLGNALKDMNQVRRGMQYIERSYALGRQLHDSNTMETALINLGDGYEKLNEPRRSVPAFTAALPLARALDDVSGQASTLQGIAQGLFSQGRYTEAATLLRTEAIPFALGHDQKETGRNLLLLMSDVQLTLGDRQSSQRYRRSYDSISQLLMNASLLKNIQELETKYEVERQQHALVRKDLLLEQKDKQALRQRSWLIAAIAGVLVLTALFLLTWRFYRQKHELHLRTIEALQTQQENVRLKATLEGQLNERQRISQEMHDDMGSGLTSLLFLSRTLSADPTAAGPAAPGPAAATSRPAPDTGHPAPAHTVAKMQGIAEQLIRKMNEIIWTLNHEQDTLDSLVAYIRSNMAETLEHAGIDFRCEVSEPVAALPLSQEFRRNIYLIVKEAVHNIVRHAGAGAAAISIGVVDHQLGITVSDNGRGIDPSAGNRFGNGMKNMRRRAEQIGATLELVSRPGVHISVLAPLPPATP